MKKFLSSAAVAVILAGCTASEAPAGQTEAKSTQSTVPVVQTTCQEAEYNQLDFWLGDWELSWDAGDGKTGQGHNLITKSPFGNCVVTENFDGTPDIPLKGLSVSTYSKPHKLWRQSWVDNNGSYFALYGGPNDDGTFSLEMERINDKGPYSRMIWKDITEDSLTWHWQGKKAAEDDWADQWVIFYSRKK